MEGDAFPVLGKRPDGAAEDAADASAMRGMLRPAGGPIRPPGRRGDQAAAAGELVARAAAAMVCREISIRRA
jgi:hypothetical protein